MECSEIDQHVSINDDHLCRGSLESVLVVVRLPRDGLPLELLRAVGDREVVLVPDPGRPHVARPRRVGLRRGPPARHGGAPVHLQVEFPMNTNKIPIFEYPYKLDNIQIFEYGATLPNEYEF